MCAGKFANSSVRTTRSATARARLAGPRLPVRDWSGEGVSVGVDPAHGEQMRCVAYGLNAVLPSMGWVVLTSLA